MAQTWDESLAMRVGAEVARLRRDRGISAARLSELTSDLSYPLSRSLIADLEVGRRGARLQLAEVLVLAKALQTSPVRLIFPGLPDEPTEVLPGETVTAFEALLHFTGESAPRDNDDTWFMWALRRQRALVEEFRELAENRRQIEEWDRSSDPAFATSPRMIDRFARRTELVSQKLVALRDDIRGRGFDPGALDPEMAYLDELTPWEPLDLTEIELAEDALTRREQGTDT